MLQFCASSLPNVPSHTYIYQKVVQYLHVDLQVAKPQHDEMWQRLAKQNSQKPQIDEMFQHFVSWVSQVSTVVQLTTQQRVTFVTFWSYVNYFKLTEDKKTVHNIRVSNIF